MVTYDRIAILASTSEQLRLCKIDFLKHHPEFEHVYITSDKIVYELAKFYLDSS